MIRFLTTHLRAKLMVLVILPLLGGAALTLYLMVRQNQSVQGLAPVTATSHLGQRLDTLIHAVQAERGATALYQGAHGAPAMAELQARREATDGEIANLRGPLAATEDAGALKALEQLPILRASVPTGTPTHLLEGYTRILKAQFELQERLIHPATSSPLEARFHALSTLRHLKEEAELERAVLANAFSTHGLSGEPRDRFLGLLAAQQAYEGLFHHQAPAEWREALTQALREEGDGTSTRIRSQALALAPGASLEEDPYVWFRAATLRLEALKRVEDRFSHDLVSQAESMEASARRTRLFLGVGALLFGALVLAWTHLTGEAILRPIQTLEAGFLRLQQGDLSVRLPILGGDETARMTQAFNTTCAQLGELALRMKAAAHQVAGGAQGLCASAEKVSGSTGQLARSALVQRQAAEQVAAAMSQLDASIQQVQDTLAVARREGHQAHQLAGAARALGLEAHELVDGIRLRSDKAVQASGVIAELGKRLTQALGTVTSEPVRQALDRCIQAADLAAALARQNGAAVAQGQARLDELTAALDRVALALATSDALAQEIHQVAQDQAAASREVTRRMEETSKGTGEVQLAAAQLANTAPEVQVTANALVGVAHGLATTADTFVLG